MFKKIKNYYVTQVRRNQKQLLSQLDKRLPGIKQSALQLNKNEIFNELKIKIPNAPVLFGYKVYSAMDEDGIISHIFSKIPNSKTFIEIGCGNGIENNTHLLLLLSGWKGVWVDGSENNINEIFKYLGSTSFENKLLVERQFINVKNITELYAKYIEFLKIDNVDFFSIDIDGVDIYIIEQLLKTKIKPKVFCVEYNSKFPPPIEVKVKYIENFSWDGSNYQSASLQSWVTLMQEYNYVLVSCNIGGVNAFFVDADFAGLFPKYSIMDLYMPPRYYLTEEISGHNNSFNFLKDALQNV